MPDPFSRGNSALLNFQSKGFGHVVTGGLRNSGENGVCRALGCADGTGSDEILKRLFLDNAGRGELRSDIRGVRERSAGFGDTACQLTQTLNKQRNIGADVVGVNGKRRLHFLVVAVQRETTEPGFKGPLRGYCVFKVVSDECVRLRAQEIAPIPLRRSPMLSGSRPDSKFNELVLVACLFPRVVGRA